MKKIKEETGNNVDARGLLENKPDKNSKDTTTSDSVNEKMKQMLKVYCTGKLQNISDYSLQNGYRHSDHKKFFAELISEGKKARKKPFLLPICIQVNTMLRTFSPSSSYTLDSY